MSTPRLPELDEIEIVINKFNDQLQRVLGEDNFIAVLRQSKKDRKDIELVFLFMDKDDHAVLEEIFKNNKIKFESKRMLSEGIPAEGLLVSSRELDKLNGIPYLEKTYRTQRDSQRAKKLIEQENKRRQDAKEKVGTEEYFISKFETAAEALFIGGFLEKITLLEESAGIKEAAGVALEIYGAFLSDQESWDRFKKKIRENLARSRDPDKGEREILLNEGINGLEALFKEYQENFEVARSALEKMKDEARREIAEKAAAQVPPTKATPKTTTTQTPKPKSGAEPKVEPKRVEVVNPVERIQPAGRMDRVREMLGKNIDQSNPEKPAAKVAVAPAKVAVAPTRRFDAPKRAAVPSKEVPVVPKPERAKRVAPPMPSSPIPGSVKAAPPAKTAAPPLPTNPIPAPPKVAPAPPPKVATPPLPKMPPLPAPAAKVPAAKVPEANAVKPVKPVTPARKDEPAKQKPITLQADKQRAKEGGVASLKKLFEPKEEPAPKRGPRKQ